MVERKMSLRAVASGERNDDRAAAIEDEEIRTEAVVGA
jgi:hypothetical protein